MRGAMVTYQVLATEAGCTAAFEIENLGVTRGGCARLLRKISGVTDVQSIKWRRLLRTDQRVTFKYFGHDFEVTEPFGDNSRYWIGPVSPSNGTPDITAIEDAFKRAESFTVALLLDVLTLRPLRRWLRRC